MVALELVIDASGMQRGAQQAATALDGVAQKATATEQAVRKTGTALSAAFQATGGSVQIAQGISQAARAFGELNVSAGAFSAARTVLEVAKTAQDFRELSAATGATGSVFSTLGAIMRAHPLLTIATVVSTAAGALSFFTGETKKTASAWGDLADNMRKARIEESVTRALGAPSGGPTSAALRNELGRITDTGEGSTVAGAAGALGGSKIDVARFLANNGDYRALEYLRTGSYSRAPGSYGANDSPRSTDIGSLGITNDQLRALITRSYSERSGSRIGVDYSQGIGPIQEDINAANTSWSLMGETQRPGSGVLQSSVEQRQVALEKYAEDQERTQQRITESMRQAEQYARGIGAAVGAAAFDMLTGAQSIRGALAGLVGGVARQGLQSALGAAFGSLGSLVGGKTGTQTRADNGLNYWGEPR